MKSIDPDDFKVTKKISLSELPTNLFNKSDAEKKEEKLYDVQIMLS